jgi:hypothetical protein
VRPSHPWIARVRGHSTDSSIFGSQERVVRELVPVGGPCVVIRDTRGWGKRSNGAAFEEILPGGGEGGLPAWPCTT